MECYVCGGKKCVEILNKPNVRVWTNTGYDPSCTTKNKRCVLEQCVDCGHVFQPVNNDLRDDLREIYSSHNAQLSTPLGKGNWGLEMARRFFDIFSRAIGPDLKRYRSAVEIGCADGYFLRCLKTNGFEELVGIEPSIEHTEEAGNILFLKEFADEKLQLSKKYDLVFAFGVFEHIEKIAGMMNFCGNHLLEGGSLFVSVPDAQKQLQKGDPALFAHQHIQYFTENSLDFLFKNHGFGIRSLITEDSALNACAQACQRLKPHADVRLYVDYQEKLDNVLAKCERILRDNKVIVHGASNALHNILGWLGEERDFVLIDNDNTKHNKKYFGKVVRSMADVDLKDYGTVLIIPVHFRDEIKAQYVQGGFNGRFESVEIDNI